MTGKRDNGAGLRRTPPEDAADMLRRAADQAGREDEFDRSMQPKPDPPDAATEPGPGQTDR